MTDAAPKPDRKAKTLRQTQWYGEAREAQRALWAQAEYLNKTLTLMNGGAIALIFTLVANSKTPSTYNIELPILTNGVLLYAIGAGCAMGQSMYQYFNLRTYMEKSFNRADILYDFIVSPEEEPEFEKFEINTRHGYLSAAFAAASISLFMFATLISFTAFHIPEKQKEHLNGPVASQHKLVYPQSNTAHVGSAPANHPNNLPGH
jgi:hypothetical protein